MSFVVTICSPFSSFSVWHSTAPIALTFTSAHIPPPNGTIAPSLLTGRLINLSRVTCGCATLHLATAEKASAHCSFQLSCKSAAFISGSLSFPLLSVPLPGSILLLPLSKRTAQKIMKRTPNCRSPLQPSLYNVYSSGGLLTGIYSSEQKD
jgi:hypothetical protein